MTAVLVPLEGSRVSERAIPLAVMLAAATHTELTLLRVVQPVVATNVGPYLIELEEAALIALQKQAALVRQVSGLDATTVCRFGFPPEVIVHEATTCHGWCIVMASHSRGGLPRTILGSVVETVIDTVPLPVFVVPIGVRESEMRPFKRILVPLDGSERAAAILPAVDELALRFAAEVVRVHVLPLAAAGEGTFVEGISTERRPLVDFSAATYGSRKGGATRAPAMDRVEAGEPIHEIARACRESDIDLVAFATHGHSDLAKKTLSRVARTMLRENRVPLMVFGRQALRQLASGSLPRLGEEATAASARRLSRRVPVSSQDGASGHRTRQEVRTHG